MTRTVYFFYFLEVDSFLEKFCPVDVWFKLNKCVDFTTQTCPINKLCQFILRISQSSGSV